ncbi:MAG: serine/threonine-protein kinase [Planctomycetota bacterium]|jgi:serine/threonine-protein kinase
MPTTHPSTDSSRGGLAFLQRRLSIFGLVAGGLFLFALLCRGAIAIATRDHEVWTHPSFLYHVLGVVVFLGVWALARGPTRSRRYLQVIEFAGLFLGCSAIVAMGSYVPHRHTPELIVAFALTLGLVARAVFVPSSARLTLLVGAVVGVPLILSVYLSYRAINIDSWRTLDGEWSEYGALGVAFGKTLSTAFWWVCTLIVCTAASRVIYGLRREIDEAKQLGQYTLEEKLGEGAMGMVYRAHHAMLRRPCAVKLLLPDKVGEMHLARFEREVQLTARLTHPHTVTIFDYGRTPDGIFYYAMELLEGAAIDRIIQVDGPQPPERVAYILDQVAAALAEAHGIGLIHRDIKPANIILTEQGGEPDVAKVVDFGLVKDIRSGDADPVLSQVEMVAGTPLYMSPETILAYHEIDSRSDLYALGAVCYFMLTGEPVFKGRTAAEVCTQHVHDRPVPPSKRCDSPVPPDLEALILACLEKDPAGRPQSANHIRARLWAGETYTRWNTDRARRWWRKHGDALRSRRGQAPYESSRTIAIDLARHGA